MPCRHRRHRSRHPQRATPKPKPRKQNRSSRQPRRVAVVADPVAEGHHRRPAAQACARAAGGRCAAANLGRCRPPPAEPPRRRRGCAEKINLGYRLPRRTEVRWARWSCGSRARQWALRRVTRRGAWSRHCGAALPWHLHRRSRKDKSPPGLAADKFTEGVAAPTSGGRRSSS